MPKIAETIAEILLEHSDNEHSGHTGQEKTSVSLMTMWKIIRGAAIASPFIAAGAASIPFIKELMDNLRQKKELRDSFEEITKDPDLQKDPEKVAPYFLTLIKFAPSVAADPIIAKSVIKQMLHWGPEAGYALLKDLVFIEEKVTKRKPDRGGLGLEGFLRTLPGIAAIKPLE